MEGISYGLNLCYDHKLQCALLLHTIGSYLLAYSTNRITHTYLTLRVGLLCDR